MDSGLKGSDLAVAVAIWSYSDRHGRCWPAVASLVTRSGVSRTAVLDALKRLECGGVVTLEREDGKSHHYQIDLSALPVRLAHRCPECTRTRGVPPGTPGVRVPVRLAYHTGTPGVHERIKNAPEERIKERASIRRPDRAASEKPHPRAIAMWLRVHRAELGADYPMLFKGRDHDGTKVKRWLAAVKLDVKEPSGERVETGMGALESAMEAYLRHVKAGAAFPFGEPATTKHFTRDLAKWLQTDPNRTITPRNGHTVDGPTQLERDLAELEALKDPDGPYTYPELRRDL